MVARNVIEYVVFTSPGLESHDVPPFRDQHQAGKLDWTKENIGAIKGVIYEVGLCGRHSVYLGSGGWVWRFWWCDPVFMAMNRGSAYMRGAMPRSSLP